MKGLPISALFEALAETLSAEEIAASTIKANFANQIIDWRMKHQLTQKDLADRFGVNQSTISKWENGDYNFTIDKLAEIACGLDLILDISMRQPNSYSEATAKTYKSEYSANIVSIQPYLHLSSSANDSMKYTHYEAKEE